MNYTEEERRQKAIEFYKEKFDMNLEGLSPEKIRQVIAEIKKQLDEEIEEKKEENKKLNIEICELDNTIVETQQDNN